MWFKSLHLYRLHAAPAVSVEQLAEQMACYASRPLGNSDARRIGWAAPAGRLGGGQLV
ncbi:MAG: recombination-associated protein RdgC, partial [Halomonas sp.]|uniref:recombination-associated protein RdgC n=1 Tax=Halomonas sp. TaxID=1486246 RepID=UPI003F90494E